ncbi:MAG: hypothetical protein AAGL49_10435, partial [Pseudomonadota bacterium]
IVWHPPRTYREKVEKIRREIHAHVDLYWLFPDRFPYFRPTLGKIKMYALPPRFRTRFDMAGEPWRRRAALYALHWWLNIRRAIEVTPYILLGRRSKLPQAAYGASHGFPHREELQRNRKVRGKAGAA